MSDTPVSTAERDRKVRRLQSVGVANFPVGLTDGQLDFLLERLDDVGKVWSEGIMSLLPISTGEDWIDQLVDKEAQRLRGFFGQSFDMTLMANTLSYYGREKIEQWQGLGLAVGYLPAMVLTQKTKIRGWRKPIA